MKVYVEVFGCTANKGDASLVKGVLKDNGHEIVENTDKADALVILTCTVIGTTEQRMLSRLKILKETGKKVIVAGCMASVQADLIKSIIPNAGLLSPQYSHHISEMLEGKPVDFIEENKTQFSKHFDDIIAPISIAEGCMFSCSYCITSQARGKLKSYPIHEIVNDICYAINQGCREIQLTAQDTSSFGIDSGSNLGNLLTNISQIKGEYRIRVGMMNPYTCKININPILDGFKEPRIYKFLHLPVQSGDNIILKKMGRKYSADDFLTIVDRFRNKYQDITISTDIIVGFPTETDDQFQNTINLINNVKPDITNITRFSARPNTKAKTMKGRIKTEIVKERSKILTNFCSKISEENNRNHIDKKYNILITEKGKNNTFVGRAENYKPVVIKNSVKIGEILPVKIIDAASTYLVGSII